MINEVEIINIFPDPDQPRKTFNGKQMFELEQSVTKEGILSPLILESNFKGDKYLILDGERRFRIATELGLKTVPATIIEGPLTFEQRTIKRFNVQEQHQNWSDFDRAKAIHQFKKETKLSLVEIADKLNCYVPKLHGLLSITEFSETGEKMILEKNIPFTFLIFLIRIVKTYQFLLPDYKKETIETKMIDKIVKLDMRVSEINILSQIISSSENLTEKIEFLENEQMTVEDLILKTGEGEKQERIDFYRKLLIFDKVLTKALNNKLVLTKEYQEIVMKIKEKINKI